MIMQAAHLLHLNHLPNLWGGINDSTRRSRAPTFFFFFFFLNFFIGFQLMTIVYDNCTIYH